MQKNMPHTKNRTDLKKTQTSLTVQVVNMLLLVSFIVTLLVPLTGLIVHKLAATAFLLLCVAHTLIYRKKLDRKKYVILALVILAFFTGIFGMILDSVLLLMVLHRVISIVSVFFLAIHIFVFGRRLI